MHCHCGTNNRAPRWTFTDPCKPEVRPGAREESVSLAWLAAPAMNARDTTKVYIWRLDTVCELTLYRKCHSHNTPGKRHINTRVEPLAGNCTTSSSYLVAFYDTLGIRRTHSWLIPRVPTGGGSVCDNGTQNKVAVGCRKMQNIHYLDCY